MMAPPSVPNPLLLEEGAAAAAAAHGNMASLHQRDVDRGLFRPPARPRPSASARGPPPIDDNSCSTRGMHFVGQITLEFAQDRIGSDLGILGS